MIKDLFRQLILWIIQLQARLVLKKYRPKIVAVTGSVGKTSTKDAIYQVLSQAHFVRKSEKSFNSDIGIPLTILGVPNAWYNPLLWLQNLVEGCALILLKNHYPNWLVLEVGADRPGDIKRIAEWLKPDVVVVTRLPDVPVHVEFFDSPEEVAREKAHLVKALKESGVLVLNNDDEGVRAFAAYARSTPLYFGFSEHSNFKASNDQISYRDGKPTGYIFRVDYQGKSVPIELEGVIGVQFVYPALAALAVGSALGMNLITMGQALQEWKTAPGRMRLIEGAGNTILIDDTYNASPVAVAAALEVLGVMKTGGRKVAVLGDMLELGKYSATEHRSIGEIAATVCDLLVVVGVRAKAIAEGAREHSMDDAAIMEFEDAKEAASALQEKLQEGDTILIKGSQSMRMERVVEGLMAHPEEKNRLLVRQEAAWQNR